MPGGLLVTLNAGSSSLKLALFTATNPPECILTDKVERIDGRDPAHILELAMARMEGHGGFESAIAVGHRIVHGGPSSKGPRVLSAEVMAELRALVTLDPDHLPTELAVVDAIRKRAPRLVQVGCFDTSFHRTMPRVTRLLPIPRCYEQQGLQRYGFHGLSYGYLIEELAKIAGKSAAQGRVILAHLGSGCSLTALRDGLSVDTTMGFTPTSGVPMGTRSGDLDPGVVLYLLRTAGMSVDALDELVNRQAGLVGMSGTSSDVRDLLAREANDPDAADALAVFCHRTRQAIGALAATIGGVDTLIFSGGIGENSAPLRARIAGGLEHLGIRIDESRNGRGEPIISTDGCACTVRVIATNEEVIIARDTMRVVGIA